MSPVVVCAYCWTRGVYGVPARTTVVTSSGINTACRQCADELADAMAAAWDAERDAQEAALEAHTP